MVRSLLARVECCHDRDLQISVHLVWGDPMTPPTESAERGYEALREAAEAVLEAHDRGDSLTRALQMQSLRAALSAAPTEPKGWPELRDLIAAGYSEEAAQLARAMARAAPTGEGGDDVE